MACTPSVRYTHSSTRQASGATGDESHREKTNTSTTQHDRLKQAVESYLGVPYQFGGTSRSGIDCSGLVLRVFDEVYNIQLPHSSRKMRERGISILPANARAGDLVFFRGNSNRINHVGIYMGERRFVHASSSRGVIYSNLDQDYYRRRYAGMRRITR
ncbi:NlpC/P60 family protein [Chitinispirillales bacterium ANBcel5]|uniref:C40 family peptidase n=1 Tax=Cellulosispirillum alkaliphilum TaxID=3039283 RepID=UPI002A50FDFF|nr:NlpC/P60 family protein [Chitinispirillales bacterium ANBcel5]